MYNTIINPINGKRVNINSVFGVHSSGGIGDIETKGINCNCTKISYKPDMDMGVFEHSGFILPKKFEISLTIATQDNRFNLRI